MKQNKATVSFWEDIISLIGLANNFTVEKQRGVSPIPHRLPQTMVPHHDAGLWPLGPAYHQDRHCDNVKPE